MVSRSERRAALIGHEENPPAPGYVPCSQQGRGVGVRAVSLLFALRSLPSLASQQAVLTHGLQQVHAASGLTS